MMIGAARSLRRLSQLLNSSTDAERCSESFSDFFLTNQASVGILRSLSLRLSCNNKNFEERIELSYANPYASSTSSRQEEKEVAYRCRCSIRSSKFLLLQDSLSDSERNIPTDAWFVKKKSENDSEHLSASVEEFNS